MVLDSGTIVCWSLDFSGTSDLRSLLREVSRSYHFGSTEEEISSLLKSLDGQAPLLILLGADDQQILSRGERIASEANVPVLLLFNDPGPSVGSRAAVHPFLSFAYRSGSSRDLALAILQARRLHGAVGKSRVLRARLQNLFLNNPSVIMILDPESGTIVDANQAATEFYGYSRRELREMKIWEINHLPESLVKEKMRMAGRGRQNRFLFQHQTKSGAIRDVEVYSGPYPLGHRMGLFSSIYDVTDRRNAERRIDALLREKDLLLREVHHRIKNNMMVIRSLLVSDMPFLAGADSREVLRVAAGHLDTMQVLYDRLYRTELFQAVDVHDHFHHLVTELSTIYGDILHLETEIQVDHFIMAPNQLFPLGLIINEWISNAVKHGFRDRSRGKIFLSVSRVGDSVKVVFGDDGRGGREEFLKGEGFGSTLVAVLADQLNGEVSHVLNPGLTWTLVFPRDKK